MAADRPQSETHTRLLALYDAAVAAAHPDVCLPAHLPSPPEYGRLTIVGAGKAAAALTVIQGGLYAVRYVRNWLFWKSVKVGQKRFFFRCQTSTNVTKLGYVS